MKYAELWMEGTIAMVPFKATFAIAIARPRGKQPGSLLMALWPSLSIYMLGTQRLRICRIGSQ